MGSKPVAEATLSTLRPMLAGGVACLVIGFGLALPMEYDTQATLAQLAPLQATWWRLGLWTAIAYVIAFRVRGRSPRACLWLSAIGSFPLVYLGTAWLAGLPSDLMPLPALLLIIGTYVIQMAVVGGMGVGISRAMLSIGSRQ